MSPRTSILVVLLCFRSALCKHLTYKMKGSDVILTPDDTSGSVKSILWKHGDNLAMEHHGSPNSSLAYEQFEERGSLNTDNGAMTITGLTRNDSGVYTVEINNQVNKKITLEVIASVLKPHISASCHGHQCNLTCEGDTVEANPVSYIWIFDKKQTQITTKEYTITKDENIKDIQCELKNPVSHQQSDPYHNPLISTESPENLIYKKEGSEVILMPDDTAGSVTSILWKHGDSLAMEYYEGHVSTLAYRQFKERGSLNTDNGAMTIKGLTHTDSGVYTVVINGQVNKKITLKVIASVLKPHISASCHGHQCVLTCEGDTVEANPVFYSWISDKKQTTTKEYTITKDENVKVIQCELKNPVSHQRSDPYHNPLISPESPVPTGAIIGAVILVLICGIVLAVLHRTGIFRIPFDRICPARAKGRGAYHVAAPGHDPNATTSTNFVV